MPRYFVEVAYKGTQYAGFQVQQNANTIQGEIEKALNILHASSNNDLSPNERKNLILTGSSRTDAGVHALQNFFHFDCELPVDNWKGITNEEQLIYKCNAILPGDIVVRKIFPVAQKAHCRFDATSREYIYRIHRFKNPFLQQTSYFFPYSLNFEALNQAAAIVKEQTNFFSFAKSNTEVKNFYCTIYKCQWGEEGEQLVFNIEANRFLRGMVRLLTASLLKVGRSKLSLAEFKTFFEQHQKSGSSVPAHGLFLKHVEFPASYFNGSEENAGAEGSFTPF